MRIPGEESDLIARYSQRSRPWYRRLRAPLPLIHNRAEKLLPPGKGWKLFLGGAGGNPLPGFINVDILEVAGVDIVADVERLPFAESSIAAIECDAVLEHVADPGAAVRELYRVLRPGAALHVVVPFCQAFHAYPSDFQRWTTEGLKRLFAQFEILDVGVRTGPTATLLSFFLEYLKLPFPGTLGKAIYTMAGWMLWPLRYLDLWFNRLPRAYVLANAVYILVRKPV